MINVSKVIRVRVGGEWLYVAANEPLPTIVEEDGQRFLSFVMVDDCYPGPRALVPLGHVQAVVLSRTWDEAETEKKP